MTLGERIQLLRKKNGWSQEALAEKINVSRQALSKWESDAAAPNVENIAQLSKLFGVTTDYLITGQAQGTANENKTEEAPKKKHDWKLITAVAVTAVLLIIVVVLLNNLQTVRDQLANAEPQIIYESGEDYPDSLFHEATCELAEDSLSLEKGTVDYKVKLVPVEFNENTSVRIKVMGETFEDEYNLKRNDNTFTGIITVSAFEDFYVSAILEDGTRTETGSACEEAAYCYSGFMYEMDGYVLSWFENKVRVNNGFHYSGEDEYPESITVVLKQNENEVYKKELSPTYEDGETFFEWEDSIEISGGVNTDIYLVHEDEHGFIYQYKMGYLEKGIEWPVEKDRMLKIADPDGTVIYERWIPDEE